MNPNTKIFTTILSLTIVAAAAYAIIESRRDVPQAQEQPQIVQEEKIGQAEYEQYLRENINSLSPEKPVLGGTFYVTGISWTDERSARVSYEDGHIALDATVVFSADSLAIESFVVDPEDRIPDEERGVIEEPLGE